MSLSTAKKAGTFWPGLPPEGGIIDLHHGKRPLQSMLRAMGEVKRIMELKKPSYKSHERARLLQEMIVKALGVDSFEAAENALTQAQRQRVSSSIEGMLKRAEMREKRAATKRVRDEVSEARRQARERKDDARQKIIVGGTIITAIRDNVPATPAILSNIQARLPIEKWPFVEPIFAPSDDEKLLAGLQVITRIDPEKVAAKFSDQGQLAKLYKETETQLERALDIAQAWNDPEQRRQRAADAHRKAMIGGAILAAIREGDSTAPVLLQLLDERVGSVRDREAIRVILPLAEFRPKGRL